MAYKMMKDKIIAEIARTLNVVGVPYLQSVYHSMQVGAPSILIMKPPPRKPDARGVAFVVLHERRKLTTRQHQWWNIMDAFGFRLAIVFDASDATERLERWGYLDVLAGAQSPIPAAAQSQNRSASRM